MILAICLVAMPAAASTIIPAEDPGALARTSDAVVLVRAAESAVVSRSGMLLTVVQAEVLAVVAGSLTPGETIEIAVPGGVLEGRGWLVAGSPRLAASEEDLLFAGRGGDGRWRPRMLADSVLRREREADGTPVLVPVEASRELKRLGTLDQRGLVPAPVLEEPFLERLRDAVHGGTDWRWQGLWARSAEGWSELKTAPSGCAFMTYQDRHIRWQLFDNGGTQEIWADSAGDASVDGEVFDLVSNAIDRWMGVSGTSLALVYAGPKDYSMTCTDRTDDDTPRSGDDIVVFNDPCDDIDDLENCGGTLAFGGPWFGALHSFDSDIWYTATSWFVVVNNGIGDCLTNLDYELVLTHELGHGLGFGHTEDTDSLMFANCCSPHNDLDNSCARYLYPSDDPASGDVVVPVIAFLDGLGGTPWRSDVVVANPTDRRTVLELAYRPGSGVPIEVSRTLPPRSTLFFQDMVSSVFGTGDGRGPLRVRADDSRVTPVVVSRTYAERSFGNLGSGLPTDLEPAAGTFLLPGLFDDDWYRSNVSVTADSGADLTATFELFRGGEGLIASAVRSVAAGEQEQWKLDSLFPGEMSPSSPMTVRATLDHPGVVNASLIDNLSTDSAVFVGKEPSPSWVVPVVAHVPGKEGTVWTSNVSIWNASGGPVTVELEYLPQNEDNSAGGPKAAPISLDAFETRTLVDPVLALFGIDDGAGALRIEASGSIVATSRVATAGPNGGTSGNGVRTIHGSEWSSGDLVLPGVRLLDGFRTNVGLVTGDEAVRFQCRLYNGNGAIAAEATLEVPARSLRQRSVEQIFGAGLKVPDPVGTIVVEGDGEYLAYMTVIDGTAQDPVFVMPR